MVFGWELLSHQWYVVFFLSKFIINLIVVGFFLGCCLYAYDIILLHPTASCLRRLLKLRYTKCRSFNFVSCKTLPLIDLKSKLSRTNACWKKISIQMWITVAVHPWYEYVWSDSYLVEAASQFFSGTTADNCCLLLQDLFWLHWIHIFHTDIHSVVDLVRTNFIESVCGVLI